MRKLSIWLLCLTLLCAMTFGAAAVMAEETEPQDLTKALAEAVPGQTVTVKEDTQVLFLSVPNEVTLDLNGKTLTATYVSAFGNIEDGSAENTGLLKVDANKLLLKTTNSQLPVKTAEGYKFISMRGFNTRVLDGGARYVFQPLFEAAAHEMLKDGAAATGVSVQVLVTWKSGADTDSRTFVFGDNFVTQFINSYVSTGGYGKMFQLTVSNPDKFEDLQYTAMIVTESGVTYQPAKLPAEVTEDVTIKNDQASAVVAAGVKLTDKDVSLELTTNEMAETTSNVTLADGETIRSIDVHVIGVAEDNTVPVIVTLNEAAVKGLNEGNIKLYHVENGVTNEMTRVYTVAEVDAHNEFYYDIPTGTITLALKSFSEVAVVADEKNYWKGTIAETLPTTADGNYEIFNADQLAKFGAMVDAGNTFEGKTVTLCMDVYLSDGSHADGTKSFNPIGFGYEFNGGQVFKGTFDGNGNTVYNLYQNGWSLGDEYSYSMAGGGLFASVVDATIKNLTIDGAYVVMECIDMGVVVGYANGNCTFENTVVKNSLIANYQRATGGAIGELGGGGKYTLTNVDVEASTVVSSLWGDFDAPLGGIVGGVWHEAGTRAGKGTDLTVNMVNCDVAATINAYNDVTSAYQWYSYRRAGMLIGNSEESKTVNGRTEATADYLTTTNCTVQYGDWVNYTYCEFGDTTSMGARYPWVRVQPGYSCGAFSNPRYGVPTFDGKTLDVANHATLNDCHNETDGHLVSIPFQQLYGGGQGCYGGNSHIGNGVEIISNLKQTVKFVPNVDNHYRLVRTADTITVKLSDLFKAIDGMDIASSGVYAYVTPTNAQDSVRGYYNAADADIPWEERTLTISGNGAARITISDYYYCVPAYITLTVADCYYTVTYMDGETELAVDYVKDNSKAHNLMAAGENMQWLDSEGKAVTQIPAGNAQDVVVYKDEVDQIFAYFLDKDGAVYKTVQITEQTTSIEEPAVPAIEGYFGHWEKYSLPTSVSIVIKPVYTVDETYEELYQNMDVKQLFAYLSDGKTVVMSQELEGGQGNASQKECAIITQNANDKESRLNLNGYTLVYDFAANGNKDWKIFEIKGGSTLIISGGIDTSGVLVMKLTELNSNARPVLFDLDAGATLILEKGTIIELHYPEGADSRVSLFMVNGEQFGLNQADYPYLEYVHDADGNLKRIIVHETTVITG